MPSWVMNSAPGTLKYHVTTRYAPGLDHRRNPYIRSTSIYSGVIVIDGVDITHSVRLGEAPPLPDGDPDHHTMDRMKFDTFVAVKAEAAYEEVERLMKEERAHPELWDPAVPEEQAPAFAW